jgi:hypothetical protein
LGRPRLRLVGDVLHRAGQPNRPAGLVEQGGAPDPHHAVGPVEADHPDLEDERLVVLLRGAEGALDQLTVIGMHPRQQPLEGQSDPRRSAQQIVHADRELRLAGEQIPVEAAGGRRPLGFAEQRLAVGQSRLPDPCALVGQVTFDALAELPAERDRQCAEILVGLEHPGAQQFDHAEHTPRADDRKGQR